MDNNTIENTAEGNFTGQNPEEITRGGKSEEFTQSQPITVVDNPIKVKELYYSPARGRFYARLVNEQGIEQYIYLN